MQLPLRIAIADEQARFRQGVRSLLRLEPDLDVVAEIDDFDGIAPTLAQTPCDVLVLYLRITPLRLPLVRAIAQRVALIAVVAGDRRDDGLTAFRLGARGVLLERFAIDGLVDAIRTVADGHVWAPPTLQAYMVGQLAGMNGQLTAREREVTRCVAVGWRNGEVAEQLLISEQTVKKHLHSIFRKLGIRDRVELIRYATAHESAGPAPPPRLADLQRAEAPGIESRRARRRSTGE